MSCRIQMVRHVFLPFTFRTRTCCCSILGSGQRGPNSGITEREGLGMSHPYFDESQLRTIAGGIDISSRGSRKYKAQPQTQNLNSPPGGLLKRDILQHETNGESDSKPE